MNVHEQALELVSVNAIKEHPQNPNEGDVGAIMESIKANGFYGALIVQRSTGWILSGNHRFQAAKHIGMKKVPVFWIECDDRQALKILLADNRTAEMAIRNEVQLSELLVQLDVDNDLTGTGYDGDDLDALLNKLNEDVNELVDEEPEPQPSGATKSFRCEYCGELNEIEF